jgi:WXG100 family type VII secretion target
MADRVEVDYEELENISRMFAQEGQRAEQLFAKIRACVGELESGGWIGAGADKFYAEMNELVNPGLQRLIQALDEATDTTKKVATTFSNAEEEAGSMFR